MLSSAGRFSSGSVAAAAALFAFAAAFCKSNISDMTSNFAEADFDVAKADDVAFLYLARLAVGQAAAVDESPVGRTRVRDQQRPLLVHAERGVNLRDAAVVEVQVVVGAAADAHARAARLEDQLGLLRAVRR